MDGDGEWPTSEEVARHLRISVRAIHDWRQMQSGLVAYKAGRRPAGRSRTSTVTDAIRLRAGDGQPGLSRGWSRSPLRRLGALQFLRSHAAK
jgi:hypothetical protein